MSGVASAECKESLRLSPQIFRSSRLEPIRASAAARTWPGISALQDDRCGAICTLIGAGAMPHDDVQAVESNLTVVPLLDVSGQDAFTVSVIGGCAHEYGHGTSQRQTSNH
jgi:hypothetical protein